MNKVLDFNMENNFKDIHQLWKAYFTTKEMHIPTGLYHSEFQKPFYLQCMYSKYKFRLER